MAAFQQEDALSKIKFKYTHNTNVVEVGKPFGDGVTLQSGRQTRLKDRKNTDPYQLKTVGIGPLT